MGQKQLQLGHTRRTLVENEVGCSRRTLVTMQDIDSDMATIVFLEAYNREINSFAKISENRHREISTPSLSSPAQV